MNSKILISIKIVVWALTAFLGLTFYNRLKMPYNTEGNYFEENSALVYHEQSVLVWGLVFFVFFCFSVFVTFSGKSKLKV